MFEEVSKEYANKWLYHVKDLESHHKEDDKPEYIRILEAYQKGAEFGYNKANEWHFTNRNKEHQVIDCPKGEENKLYLLLLNSSDSKEFEFGRKVPVVCYWNEEWCRFERLEHTIGERNVNQNDINAWKEIVLP